MLYFEDLVIGHEILTGRLSVMTEDRRRLLVDAAEISLAPKSGKSEKEPNDKERKKS